MFACILSDLELRNIIERAFLPMRCNCMITGNTMTVEVIDPVTGRVGLLKSGLRLDRLDTSRALCELICALRDELNNSSYLHDHALAS